MRSPYSLLPIAAMALTLTIGSAQADMFVIASTAPGIEVDQPIANGTVLRLPDGASVTLIDANENIVTINAPGGEVRAPESGAPAQAGTSLLETLRNLLAPKGGNKLGATRGARAGTDEAAAPSADCPTLANDLTLLIQNQCEDRIRSILESYRQQVGPQLYVGTDQGNDQPRFRFGETIHLVAKANFNAFLYCFHEGSDGTTTRFIPFYGTTPRLNANAAGTLPGSLAPDDFFIEAGEPEGRDIIECYATDRDLAPYYPELLARDPFIGSHMLESDVARLFGQAQVGKLASARIAIDVHD